MNLGREIAVLFVTITATQKEAELKGVNKPHNIGLTFLQLIFFIR